MKQLLLISLCLVLGSITLSAQNIIRGPYLQKGSDSAITIKWRTDEFTQSKVEYGLSTGTLAFSETDQIYTTDHEVRLEGLSPATTYYYQIGNLEGTILPASSDLSFKTHPVIGATPPMKFWVLGDCGTANQNQRNVRDAYYNYVGADHTDGILFLGDNAYNSGTDSEYQNAIFENMYEDKLKNTIAWSTLGNHDGYTAVSSNQTGPYYDIFSLPQFGESGGLASGTEAYYSFDYGNIHFVCLESYETDRSVGGAMYNWCKNDIQNTTQEWIIAFWHHPPYSKGSHNSDTEGTLIDMRENFLPMLENNGVDLVLSGHSHSYERSYFINGHYGNSDSFNPTTNTVGANGYGNGKIGQDGSYKKFNNGSTANDGAVYITTGSAGKVSSAGFGHEAMYYSVSQLGSCVIEVDEGRLDVKFIRETGAIDDYFTIEKDSVDCVAGTSCDDGDSNTINDVYNENCECQGFSAGGSVCVYIGSSGDDVEENQNSGDMYSTSSDMELVNDGGRGDQTVGLRFTNIQVPAGATVTNAYIQFTKDGNTTGTTNLSIRAQDIADAPSISGSDYYFTTGINMTSTQVNWSPPNWNNGTSAENQRTPDLSPLVQHLVDSAGFQSGNSMLFLIQGTGQRRAFSYDDTPSLSPQLCIDYVAGSCTPGQPCSDGDPCTVGETYDANCLCNGGSPAPDADNDGVCDVLDQCPNLDDSLIGSACDDGNPCTVGEYYSAGCGCTGGQFQDSDGDGVCNANDLCYGINDNIIGQSCDDGKDCTTNDVYTTSCNCEGTPATDSDNDGVCDAQDACPGLDDALIGQPCNDNDPCTINDVYGEDCNCAGTFLDSDNDGVCNANDQCPTLNNNLIGQPCNDGDPCTIGETYDNSCGCSGGVYQDSDADGVCDGLDQCPGQNDNLIGTACNDGNPCTVNDVYDANCGCSGTFQDSDNDGVCNVNDQCPGLDDALIGQPCSTGDPCIVGQVYDDQCGCSGGTFADADADGICDAQDSCPTLHNDLIGTACDDGNDCTINDTYGNDCECSGTEMDSDNDGVCDQEDQCPGFNDNLIGQACNDGDPCTTGETYDNSCNCSGGTGSGDSDNDGICDTEDQCPGFDDALIGTSCDDGDPTTSNDVYTTSCQCQGQSAETTLCLKVDSSDDDAEEDISGVMNLTSSTIHLVNDSANGTGNQIIGLRFNNVDIPQGGTITGATLQFTSHSSNYTYTAVTVRAEDIDDAPAMVAAVNNISSRTTTANGVNWFPGWWVDEGLTGSAQRVPNLTAVIQEVVDRPGFAAGNSMMIVISGTGERTAHSYDGSPNDAAELCITFTAPLCTVGEACDDNDQCTEGESFDANCNCTGGILVDANSNGICDSAENSCLGDINGDGQVDIDDFLDLNSMFGLACTDCPEDLNNDGTVNVNDFLELNSVYGTTCGETAELVQNDWREAGLMNPQLESALIGLNELQIHEELTVVIRKMSKNSLYVYPNPNDGRDLNLKILGKSPAQGAQIIITDISGQVHYQSTWTEVEGINNAAIRLQKALAPGIYILRMESSTSTLNDPFVVQ